MIVDDEERGIIALKELISRYCNGIMVSGTASSIAEAEWMILKSKPDVLFLDIEMPGGNGFQLLERFQQVDFPIIFVTAFQEYAIKAIRCSALDYLLKPVKIADLQQAVEKIKDRQKHDADSDHTKYDFLKTMLHEPNPFRKLILSTLHGYIPVKFDDVIYCKADDSYTHFYLPDGKHHVVSKNLKEFDDILAPHHFYRIHKSYLVNLNHIERINKIDGVSVVMSNNEELPVSVRRKDDFFALFKTIG